MELVPSPPGTGCGARLKNDDVGEERLIVKKEGVGR